jgi:hypothetical protein
MGWCFPRVCQHWVIDWLGGWFLIEPLVPLTPLFECLSDLNLIIAMSWFLCACLALAGSVVGFLICAVLDLLVWSLPCGLPYWCTIG